MSRFTSPQSDSDPNSLLPTNSNEFNAASYWEAFFKQRGSQAFEWYGEYADFAHLIRRYVPSKTESFLVIGCGNSEFSSLLYDDNYKNITNVDFSNVVIEEMKQKNFAKRPLMTWLFGDITNMNEIQNSSFQNVFDKGALDALLSENTPKMLANANLLFKEIDRVIMINGKYMCITLAQDFVISSLISYFVETKRLQYEVIIDVLVNSKPSQFVPFFITIEKVDKNNATRNGLAGIRFDSFGKSLTTTSFLTPNEVYRLIRSVQEYKDKIHRLKSIESGRFQVMDFWSNLDDNDSDKSETAAVTRAKTLVPRFTFMILDTNNQPKSRKCAVFIVPTGRETEYQFSTKNGLNEIALQADCNRLFAVRLNKPHTYDNMTALQEELSPLVLNLIPATCNPIKDVIPYMSLGSENEWVEVKYGFTLVSGDFIIEEKLDDNDDDCDGNNNGNDSQQVTAKQAHPPTTTAANNEKDDYNEDDDVDKHINKAVIRRLIFLQNQNFIQTECRMMPSIRLPVVGTSENDSITKTLAQGKSKTKAKSNQKLKKKLISTASDQNSSESTTILESDSESMAVLVSESEQSLLPPPQSPPAAAVVVVVVPAAAAVVLKRQFDLTYVDDHHRAMLASLSLLLTVHNPTSKPWRGLLIGLGGGSLPNILQHYFPQTNLSIIELDGQIEEIASEYFGFYKLKGKTEVVIKDGVEYIEQYAQCLKNQKHTNNSINNNSVIQPSSCSDEAVVVAVEQSRSNNCLPSSSSSSLSSSSLLSSESEKEVDKNVSSNCNHSSSLFAVENASYIIIDVDGKDSSLGLTAPPLTFIQDSVLIQMYNILEPGGLLVMNVVARGGDQPINALIKQIKNIFQPFIHTNSTNTITNNNNNKNNDNKNNNDTTTNTGTTTAIENNNNNINSSSNNNKFTSMNSTDTESLDMFEDGNVYLIEPSEAAVNVVLVAQKGLRHKSVVSYIDTNTEVNCTDTDIVTSGNNTNNNNNNNSQQINHTNIRNTDIASHSLDIPVANISSLPAQSLSSPEISAANITMKSNSNSNNNSNNNNNKKKKSKKKSMAVDITKLRIEDLKAALQHFMTHHHHHSNNNTATVTSVTKALLPTPTQAVDQFRDDLHLLTMIDSFTKL